MYFEKQTVFHVQQYYFAVRNVQSAAHEAISTAETNNALKRVFIHCEIFDEYCKSIMTTAMATIKVKRCYK